MNGISTWVAAAKNTFADPALPYIFHKESNGFAFYVHHTGDALWIMVHWPKGGRVALRAAFLPDHSLTVQEVEETGKGVNFSLDSLVGTHRVRLEFPEPDRPFLRYTTTIKPNQPLLIPFYPRDMIPMGKRGDASGEVHISQVGARSGMLYLTMTKPQSGSILYLQNLTALADYCEHTETSVAGIVGGQWPELGMSLPPTKEKPLPAGKEFTISDAFVAFETEPAKNEFDQAKQFLNLLSQIYIHLPRPAAPYRDWMNIVKKSLDDLDSNPGCWMRSKGHSYLNAYVSDYDTPPEIMVQLAVLLPMLDYSRWSKEEIPMTRDLTAGLENFYDDKIGTIIRWLPGMESKLDGSEEHKSPRIMDSWYLHHPLLNLSRMALQEDNKIAKKLFLDSIGYAIKVAHHFNYQWPVFYNIDTLEVIKAETQPGKGGEKDVPGTYAHVMLQAWELTKEKRYLDEAKKAAKALKGTGFNLFYQANNTSFAAGAMFRLWKETRDETYLNLSYLCLANIFKNVSLWDCKYGYGKHYSTFFAVFPLNDAPYTAVYEEQEVFSAFHDYLELAEGEDILPAVSLLLTEFIRYMMCRGDCYYPPQLPKEMLAEKARTGEIDRALWIPIEDIHDGWEKSGEVGQEVYGAGFAFGLVSAHYFRIPGETFLLYIDYPVADFNKSGRSVTFSVKGDERLSCRMLLIPEKDKSLPAFSVTTNLGDTQKGIRGKMTTQGYCEFILSGNQKIVLSWQAAGSRNGKKAAGAKRRIKTS